jgi:tellurite resistance protein
MREAILRQDSPLVQIALIDWAVESKDRAAVDVLERLKQQPELNQAVQVRVANALARLSGNSSENPKEQMR